LFLDVELAYTICDRANGIAEPPFKAVFAAYDEVFAEQGIEQEHDDVLFRLLLRVGETAGKHGGAGGQVDLVACLKSVLAAQGISILQDGENESQAEDDTRSVIVGQQRQGANGTGPTGRERKAKADRRRVSFDDARLEETWLSERSRELLPSPPRPKPAPRGYLAQPPRRGRQADSVDSRRARSTSSQPRGNGLLHHAPAPKHHQPDSPSTIYTSEPDHEANPTLLFQPSQTQLEQNAEAFFTTSAIRLARRCLHHWHDTALQVQQARKQAYAIAAAHDRRALLKQAFDQLRATFLARRDVQRLEAQYNYNLKRFEHWRLNRVAHRALTNWVESAIHQRAATEVGRRRLIKVRYFHRWRTIAVENATKARSILTRKYLAVWREKLVRRQVREEQAVAFYEETGIKRCWRAWFWHFCSRRVEGWRESNVKRRALESWVQRLRQVRNQEVQAEDQHTVRIGHKALQSLRQRVTAYQADEDIAQRRHSRKLLARCFNDLRAEAKLAPTARTLALQVKLNLQRKAFRVWHLHLNLSRQAAEVDRKRILQSAWTSWNDALRCQTLARRIDARVLVESLYKWVLAERYRLYRRALDARLLRQALQRLQTGMSDLARRTAEAQRQFAESQQRRRLTYGMTKLHMAIRQREDAERAAVEFANTHSVAPWALQTWAEKAAHVRELDRWADDARFYTLCTRALSVWKEQTTRHQTNRRRNAYTQVRARIKVRIVGTCLEKWRAKTQAVMAMEQEADRHAQARLAQIVTFAVERWREKMAQVVEAERHAAYLDQQRLLASALTAMQQNYSNLAAMDEQALVIRRETDLGLMASALKKLQWAQFTAARRLESAEALWARNRDTHVRQMLRHWHAQTVARRTARTTPAPIPEEEEPESPSLRPASRAASRSGGHRNFDPASSPPTATPAYMRTPSRTRRAGRFRPIPTPAPVTPFAFDPGYLTTTPAPFQPNDPNAGLAPGAGDMSTLTPQVTPFARKLRAGGFLGSNTGALGGLSTPAPALRTSLFARSVQGGTAKSVRFAGSSRFGGAGSSGGGDHLKGS
jgi:protein SFI1